MPTAHFITSTSTTQKLRHTDKAPIASSKSKQRTPPDTGGAQPHRLLDGHTPLATTPDRNRRNAHKIEPKHTPPPPPQASLRLTKNNRHQHILSTPDDMTHQTTAKRSSPRRRPHAEPATRRATGWPAYRSCASATRPGCHNRTTTEARSAWKQPTDSRRPPSHRRAADRSCCMD